MMREGRINSGRVPTIVITRKRGIGKKAGLTFFLGADFEEMGDFFAIGFFGSDKADFEADELLRPLPVPVHLLLITLGT